MPVAGDLGGGVGGGTTASVCTISPSDQEAITNNLISRIADIEKFLSRLVAADPYASNLAELGVDLGNVLNGTLLLPSSGSPLGQGGSIPIPGDFTGTYVSGDVITIWENGVVRFEVRPSGGMTTGGVSQWAQVQINSTGSTIDSVSEVYDSSGLVTVGTGIVVITSPGLYLFSMQDLIGINTTGTSSSTLVLTDTLFGLPGPATVCEAGLVSGASGGLKFARVGTSVVTTIPSAGYVLTAQSTASASTWTHSATVSILKLS